MLIPAVANEMPIMHLLNLKDTVIRELGEDKSSEYRNAHFVSHVIHKRDGDISITSAKMAFENNVKVLDYHYHKMEMEDATGAWKLVQRPEDGSVTDSQIKQCRLQEIAAMSSLYKALVFDIEGKRDETVQSLDFASSEYRKIADILSGAEGEGTRFLANVALARSSTLEFLRDRLVARIAREKYGIVKTGETEKIKADAGGNLSFALPSEGIFCPEERLSFGDFLLLKEILCHDIALPQQFDDKLEKMLIAHVFGKPMDMSQILEVYGEKKQFMEMNVRMMEKDADHNISLLKERLEKRLSEDEGVGLYYLREHAHSVSYLAKIRLIEALAMQLTGEKETAASKICECTDIFRVLDALYLKCEEKARVDSPEDFACYISLFARSKKTTAAAVALLDNLSMTSAQWRDAPLAQLEEKKRLLPPPINTMGGNGNQTREQGKGRMPA